MVIRKINQKALNELSYSEDILLLDMCGPACGGPAWVLAEGEGSCACYSLGHQPCSEPSQVWGC